MTKQATQETFRNMGEVLAGVSSAISAYNALIVMNDTGGMKQMTEQMKDVISISMNLSINAGIPDDDIQSIIGVGKLVVEGIRLVEDALEAGELVGSDMMNGWTLLSAKFLTLSVQPNVRDVKVPILDKAANERAKKYLLDLIPDGPNKEKALRRVGMYEAGLMDRDGKSIGTVH